MSTGGIFMLLTAIAWLVLVGASYRSYRVGASKTIKLVLMWLAIFVGTAFVLGTLA